jgi:inner membrane transporter RhtA
VSGLVYLPVVVTLVLSGTLTGRALLFATTAGVLSSALPYALDLAALRTVPARFFGVFMSVHPVVAALAGPVILQQVLALHEVVGIGIVVAANVVAVGTLHSGRR